MNSDISTVSHYIDDTVEYNQMQGLIEETSNMPLHYEESSPKDGQEMGSLKSCMVSDNWLENLHSGDDAFDLTLQQLTEGIDSHPSTPELDESSRLSTPSPSNELSISSLSMEEPMLWSSSSNIQQVSPPCYPSYPSIFPELQLPTTTTITGLFTSQKPSEMSTFDYTGLQAQTYSSAGYRRSLARDMRRQAQIPYIGAHHIPNNSATAILQPISIPSLHPISLTNNLSHSAISASSSNSTHPLVSLSFQNPILDTLSQPMQLIDITCTYGNCTDSGIHTGRRGWRIHLANEHKVPGGSEAGGLCEFPGCGRFQSSSLMRHILAQHSGVVFKCRQCPRRFPREDTMRKHYTARRPRGHLYFEGRDDICYYDEE